MAATYMSEPGPDPRRRLTRFGEIVVGRNTVPKVMGIINVSPESFFKGSIKTSSDEVAEAARQMERDGAQILDIGAMSTAPYLDTLIPVEEEASRLAAAVKTAKAACGLPISADTPRAKAAEAAIAAGADAVNDVTGLKYDSRMASTIAKSGVKVIACAYSRAQLTGRIEGTLKALRASLAIARKSGIEDDILVDPSIGFFRGEGRNPFFTKMTDMQWYVRDIQVVSQLERLAALKKPVCISVSRKSFIGHLLDIESPDDRLVPSIACEIISVLRGASLVRTHSVKEAVQALTMLEILSDGADSKRL